MNYFFALPLGSLASRVNKDLLRPLQAVDADRQLRWSPPENLHITLAYLGSLSGTALEGGARAKSLQGANLRSAIAVAEQIRITSFDCDIESLGFFPDATSRVLALHVKPSPELLSLQAKLQSGLNQVGLAIEEREYKPHITLARLNHRQHISGWQLPGYSASFPVQQFALYSSEPSSRKSEAKLYQKIAEFPL